MPGRVREYYFGSLGIIRGYGPLCRTMREADGSIRQDAITQRRRTEGTTDRYLVAVSPDTGLCWRWEEGVHPDAWSPARLPSGSQARYPADVIRTCETLWRELVQIGGE